MTLAEEESDKHDDGGEVTTNAKAPASTTASADIGVEKASARVAGVGVGVPGGEDRKARPPAKYLNSPETGLFKKGKNVFGLDLAKEVRVGWIWGC